MPVRGGRPTMKKLIANTVLALVLTGSLLAGPAAIKVV